MILVDSSVWVDYFKGTITAQTERLDGLLGVEPLAIGDLILTEVLQGFRSDRDFNDKDLEGAAMVDQRRNDYSSLAGLFLRMGIAV